MWQHNVYYVCVTFSVVRYVGFANRPHHTERLFLKYEDSRFNYNKHSLNKAFSVCPRALNFGYFL